MLGYWIPYEAAKALAATFCYKIRYALAPVFGNDFVDLCSHPKHPDFENYSIRKDIVVRCKRQARSRRQGVSDGFELGSSTPTPDGTLHDPASDLSSRDLRPRRLKRSASADGGSEETSVAKRVRRGPYSIDEMNAASALILLRGHGAYWKYRLLE